MSRQSLRDRLGEHSGDRRTTRLWTVIFAFAAMCIALVALGVAEAVPGMSATAFQVVCVDDNGGATTTPCTNSTAFTSIQTAIIASVDGDEIRVAQGVYTSTASSVININKIVTITGGYHGSPV